MFVPHFSLYFDIEQNIITLSSNLNLFGAGCRNASFYGTNCDIPCPTNCKDSTCHIQSGACFTCAPGWTGLDCDISMNTRLVFSYFMLLFII